jgi:hypothetical protein
LDNLQILACTAAQHGGAYAKFSVFKKLCFAHFFWIFGQVWKLLPLGTAVHDAAREEAKAQLPMQRPFLP